MFGGEAANRLKVAQKPSEQIDHVVSTVHQGPSTRDSPVESPVRTEIFCSRVTMEGAHVVDGSDAPGVDNLSGKSGSRSLTKRETCGQAHSARMRGIYKTLASLDADCQRLFTQDVFPSSKAGQSRAFVGRWWGADDHSVDYPMIQEALANTDKSGNQSCVSATDNS